MDEYTKERFNFQHTVSIGNLLTFDSVQDSLTVLMYEKINLVMHEQAVRLNQASIEGFQLLDLEIDMCTSKKILMENPRLDAS